MYTKSLFLKTQPKSKHKQISSNLSFTSRHQVISSHTLLPFSYVYTSFDIPRNRNKLRSPLVSRIGFDNPLYSGYFDGRNEKLVSNLKLEDGLLFHETWPFLSHPKWQDQKGWVSLMFNPLKMKNHSPQPSIYLEYNVLSSPTQS